MKRIAMMIVVAAVVLVAAGAASASAQMGWGGPGYGRGCSGSGPDGQVNVENLKKFQKETLSQRDELMTKRAELQNEYAKQTPDTARIGEIQKQMIDIRTQIQKAAEKNGLPAWGQGRGRGGRGMMADSGRCGSGCPGWAPQ